MDVRWLRHTVRRAIVVVVTQGDIAAVAEAAAGLRDDPRNLGHWWCLARAYRGAGRLGDAKAALLDLGGAASDVGVVALATACAVALRDLEAERESNALVDRISKTHCEGSPRLDPSVATRPPKPPSSIAGGAPPPLDEVALLKFAKAAQAAAAKASQERASAKLPPSPLVSSLTRSAFAQLVPLMQIREYKRGDVVVDVGEDATTLYWTAWGSAEASRDDVLLGEIHSDSFFGEIAMLKGSTRTARVACLEATTLVEIAGDVVDRVAGSSPRLGRELALFARRRLLQNVMATSPLFGRLSDDERSQLLPEFEPRLYQRGESLLVEGQDNDSLYVIASGRCRVTEGGEQSATLGVGDAAGEISMIGRKPATAHVEALEPTLVLQLKRDRFDTLAISHPGLLAEVYKLLVDRQRAEISVHDADELIV